MQRQNISTGTPWESFVGYSRAVRVGNIVHVAGTTSTDDRGEIVGAGDAYAQTTHTLKRIEAALRAVGADRTDVVRVRIYVTNIDEWEKIGQAHHDFFQDVGPATTMVEISRLVSPDMLVEIEVEAILSEKE